MSKERKINNNEKSIDQLIVEAMEEPYEKKEDEEYGQFEQSRCPYTVCDGSGWIVVQVDNTEKVKECKCRFDFTLKRKMKNSNMDEKYWDKTLELRDLEGSLLLPKERPEERKFRGKKPANPKPEEPEDFIKRCYEVRPIKKGLNSLVEEYVSKSLNYLKQEPRETVRNLLFIGEPGRGKTLMVNLIGKEYLLQGKRVYFTTMLRLVQDVTNPNVDIQKIVSEVDLLIIDEVGYEYHTDSKWAIKQIKDMLRLRYNKKLPVVSTTNLYPNEMNELYDKSLMSLFNGTYFMVLVESEVDFRIGEASVAANEFDSLQ